MWLAYQEIARRPGAPSSRSPIHVNVNIPVLKRIALEPEPGPSTGVGPASGPREVSGRRPGLPHVEAFDGLAGDLGDDLEVLVDVQNGQSGELGGRGDYQVRD